jgi:signal transduction histidine kinase
MLKDQTFGDLTIDQLDFVHEISYCANRLERIIKQVLTAQKIDMNQLRFNIEPFSVRQLMDQVFRTNLSMMSTKQIEFVNTTTLELTIETDYARLEEVFSNLIQNSVDFVDSHGKIEIGANDSTEYLTFYVKDNGIGIPKDKQSNLFKKFYQIDTSHRRNHGGSGLGLSICKGIIVGLGGKIWLESDLNKGTTFYFSIPKSKTAKNTFHKE